MAVVYAAYDSALEKRVALKFLRPNVDVTRERCDGILSEARVAARLHHRNLVEIYDIEERVEPPFIAMELVDGRDLARVAEAAGGTLGLGETLPIARQICAAAATTRAYGGRGCAELTVEVPWLVGPPRS